MAKRFLTLALLLVFCATPALAARSMTKAYKITVTMPASVQMTDIPSAPVRQAEQMPAETAQWQTTETVMYTADNRAFLVQTTVIR